MDHAIDSKTREGPMISQKQLEEEIGTVIERAIDAKEVVPAMWLAQSVLKEWDRPDCADSDRWELCGYSHVRATVRRVIGKYTDATDLRSEPQLTLEGFDRVQKVYLVKRDGEQCMVPTDQLTADEIGTKISELDTMAEGCKLHADELRRYLDSRQLSSTGSR